MRTLRSRLLLGTAIGTTIVLFVSGLLLYALIRDALWNEFDESLATKARSLAAMMEQEKDELELEFDEADLPEFRPSDRAEYYQVWLPDGRVFARSPSLKDSSLDMVAGTVEVPGYESVTLPDGRAGRLAGVTFVPRREHDDDRLDEAPEITLVLARETAAIERTLAQLRWLLIVVGLVAVIVAALVLAWSVRRGLRPVGRLAAQIAGVGESDLSARVDRRDVPSELLPVVDRLNDLLTRLESAFQRERRFTADVAHELRTPLAGVRSMLEVALSKERELGTYRQVMSECLAINQQMHQMVENLLSLARADANQLEVRKEKVDLPALLKECWKPLERQANERGLTVDWCVQEPCTLESDRGKLHLVLQNILSNAVTYTDGGGRIRIESVSDNGQIALIATNTGSVVSHQDIERVFDRFWRGDAARQAIGQHCGLGLSLCKTLIELLGGSISAASTAGGTFIISVVFNKP